MVIPRSAAATYTFRGSVNSAKEQYYIQTFATWLSRIIPIYTAHRILRDIRRGNLRESSTEAPTAEPLALLEERARIRNNYSRSSYPSYIFRKSTLSRAVVIRYCRLLIWIPRNLNTTFNIYTIHTMRSLAAIRSTYKQTSLTSPLLETE